MLVRDLGDAWQLVRQPDHADLSGQFARAWGGTAFAEPRPPASVCLAALRHDDGWGVYDRRPTFDVERDRPTAFLDVPIPAHLAFYRACIEVVTEEDPYAGLLVSMHGAGIYNGRYGTQPSLVLSQADGYRDQIAAFVAEQEESHPARADGLGVADEERWVNYKLLQIYDRLSLYFCLRDLQGGEADAIAPVPSGYDAGEVELRIEPVGALARLDRPVSVRRASGPVHAGSQDAPEAFLRRERRFSCRLLRDANRDGRDHRPAGLTRRRSPWPICPTER